MLCSDNFQWFGNIKTYDPHGMLSIDSDDEVLPCLNFTSEKISRVEHSDAMATPSSQEDEHQKGTTMICFCSISELDESVNSRRCMNDSGVESQALVQETSEQSEMPAG